MIRQYYFTFGSDERFPYQNGYLIVIAEKFQEAVQAFRNKYLDRTEGVLNCSDYYSQGEWDKVLSHGYYANESPKEVLYASPALKREMTNFGTILEAFNLNYQLTSNGIMIQDSMSNFYSDKNNNPVYFEDTIEALNSIDWMFDQIKPIYLCDPDEALEQETEEKE